MSGEKGIEVVTPFYAGFGSTGDLEGIFIDRGWINETHKDLKIHH